MLVGQQGVVRESLDQYDLGGGKIEIVPASQIVLMHESPTEAIRGKKESSIAVAARLLGTGDADAMISAGNTGAALVTTRSFLGKLKGLARPAIASIVPNEVDFTILLDVGANAGGCRPEHLRQFAIMGEIYAREVMGKENPRVGLLSVGEEESKGSAVTLSAFPLLAQSPINLSAMSRAETLSTGRLTL